MLLCDITAVLARSDRYAPAGPLSTHEKSAMLEYQPKVTRGVDSL